MRKAEKRKSNNDVETALSDNELNDDLDDFSSDYKLMKKLKKGKISQTEFDEAFDIDHVDQDC